MSKCLTYLRIANIMPSMLVTPRYSDGWSVFKSRILFIITIVCSMNCVFKSDTTTCPRGSKNFSTKFFIWSNNIGYRAGLISCATNSFTCFCIWLPSFSLLQINNRSKLNTNCVTGHCASWLEFKPERESCCFKLFLCSGLRENIPYSGLLGERHCKHIPPKAQRNPVMLAHSLICSSTSCSEFWCAVLRFTLLRQNGSTCTSSVLLLIG